MRPVLIVIAAALAVALFRMISRGGKTYSYTRMQTLNILPDGTEKLIPGKGTGTIVITNKTVIIDGKEYCYDPTSEAERLEAILEYEGRELRNVRVIIPDGEKHYIVEARPQEIKGSVNPA